MRLLRDLPEAEKTINSGEINLTNLGAVQSHFEREKRFHRQDLPKEAKIAFLQEVIGKSTREVERMVATRSSDPTPIVPDRVKPISKDKSMYQFSGPAEMEQKISRLKGMLAHRHPNISTGDLLDHLCDLGLQEWNPGKTVAPRKSAASKDKALNPKNGAPTNIPPSKDSAGRSKAEIRRDVFRIAENTCENCGSYQAPQTDHIIARGKGGLDIPENFRLLCRNCNQREAILDFGLKKMDPFINGR